MRDPMIAPVAFIKDPGVVSRNVGAHVQSDTPKSSDFLARHSSESWNPATLTLWRKALDPSFRWDDDA
ncbi:hypothetical protein CS053_04090 [Rhodanobacter glycinis]|jgi:hypothetical protein|uniref:Uncharacterized protein n=1 Tax=Rhodanobacter glycinis TaxID=582702 RepID=A0A5B9E0K7_9GAMM|nr:hypothetical protein [Rhodanobacter glycinis]QEE23786.1 hypothetical protein CS053_04090 [Rhodanobacter glycinis]